MKSVNDLLVALKRAYPRERLQERDAVLHYNTAKRYLAVLTAEATATLQGKDRSLFDSSLSFQSGTVIELIRHMDRRGLVFAPAPTEGERVYRSLLSAMRNLYLALGN